MLNGYSKTIEDTSLSIQANRASQGLQSRESSQVGASLGNIVLNKLSELGLLEKMLWVQSPKTISATQTPKSPAKRLEVWGYFEEASVNLEETVPKIRYIAYVKMDQSPKKQDRIIRLSDSNNGTSTEIVSSEIAPSKVAPSEESYRILSVKTPIGGFKELLLRPE